MAKIKWAVVLIFLLSLLVYTEARQQEKKTTDLLGPQITMKKKKIKASVKDPEEALKAGITAQDEKDGDVTDSIVIESLSSFLEPGRRLVTYAAFDQDDHVAKAVRELDYTDYHSPEFSFTGPLRFAEGTENLLSGVRVQDCIDGDISDKVKIAAGAGFYIDVPGEYKVRLQVSNSGKDLVTLPVTIEIYDRTQEEGAWKIRLSDYLIYLDQGAAFDAGSMIQSVTVDGLDYALTEDEETYGNEEEQESRYRTLSRSRLEIENDVNTAKPGVYEVVYHINGEGGTSGKNRLVVVVREAGKKKGES